MASRLSEPAVAELRCATVDSPLGTLLVAMHVGALVRLAFGHEDIDCVLAGIEEEFESPARGASTELDGARRELDEYFSRRRRRFETRVDLRLRNGFSRRVLEATARIPYASVSSYADVAAAAGSPRGARAAGNALRCNPVPILVPCHRVIHAGGALGGYGGHEADKAFLLELESEPEKRERG